MSRLFKPYKNGDNHPRYPFLYRYLGKSCRILNRQTEFCPNKVALSRSGTSVARKMANPQCFLKPDLIGDPDEPTLTCTNSSG